MRLEGKDSNSKMDLERGVYGGTVHVVPPSSPPSLPHKTSFGTWKGAIYFILWLNKKKVCLIRTGSLGMLLLFPKKSLGVGIRGEEKVSSGT